LREIFGAVGPTRRESLALIRSFLIDFAVSDPRASPFVQKFFCASFASHHVDSRTKICAHRREICSCAVPTTHDRGCKEVLIPSMFLQHARNARATLLGVCLL